MGSRINTLQSIDMQRHMDTAHFEEHLDIPMQLEQPHHNDDMNKRQLLSSILESKFYQSNDQAGNNRDQTLSLNDIHECHKDESKSEDEEEEEEDDKQLLESLEKRFKRLEMDNPIEKYTLPDIDDNFLQ